MRLLSVYEYAPRQSNATGENDKQSSPRSFPAFEKLCNVERVIIRSGAPASRLTFGFDADRVR